MPTNPITAEWLAGLLACLGSTPDEVAATLARAKVTGFREDPNDCPLARYVVARALALVPPPAELSAIVTPESVTVRISLTSTGLPDDTKAEAPEPVASFVARFDAGQYPALDAAAGHPRSEGDTPLGRPRHDDD